MTPHKQRFKHDPENGVYGDCHRTAIACLLDKVPEDVPHIGKAEADDGKLFEAHFNRYLKTQNIAPVSVPYGSADLASLFAHIEALNPDVYYILGGTSRTGVNHSVIACGGRIAWDPSPVDSGIVGPSDDGYFWVTYFVPLSLTVYQAGARNEISSTA